MGHFYFCRHADTVGQTEIGKEILLGSSDTPETHITDKGIIKAKALGEHLKKLDINTLYTSFQMRTFQTALIVENRTGIRIQSAENIKFEERNFGPLELKKREYITEVAGWGGKFYHQLFFLENFNIFREEFGDFSKAETMEDFLNRMYNAAEFLLRQHFNDSVAIIGHTSSGSALFWATRYSTTLKERQLNPEYFTPLEQLDHATYAELEVWRDKEGNHHHIPSLCYKEHIEDLGEAIPNLLNPEQKEYIEFCRRILFPVEGIEVIKRLSLKNTMLERAKNLESMLLSNAKTEQK